jgi:hypothetical protein
VRVLASFAAILTLALTGASLTQAAPPTSPSRMKAVVRAWNDRLNANDNAGVARLFALPAILIQGPNQYLLHTRAQIALWHSGLPCAGRIVSIAVLGRYATAVFRLGDRGATHCDAPGTLAAARFLIVGGKIAVWQQVPVPAPPPVAGPVA